jgi:hypothetical protein
LAAFNKEGAPMRSALLLTTVLFACGHSSPPPGAPAVVVRLPDGDCHAGATCVFDFGVVNVGLRNFRGFDLVNTGDVEDTVVRVVLSGDGAFQLDGPHQGVVVAAGGSMPFAISVNPYSDQAVESVLVVHTAAGATSIQVHLRVSGAYDGIQVSPDCNFLDVAVGATSAPCDIVLSNVSDQTVTITSASAENPIFTLTVPILFPQEIAAHQTLNLTFVARPTSLGAANGLLTLQRGGQIVVGQAVLRVNGI